jgi:hypothetical protein
MFAGGGSENDVRTDGLRAANSGIPNAAHRLYQLTERQAPGRGLRLRPSLRSKRTRETKEDKF